MRMIFFIIGLNAIFFIPNVLAAVPICSKDDAIKAEDMVSIPKSWEKLNREFKHYGHCDDGSIAEGFSETVSILLSEHWKDIDQLGVLVKSDLIFYEFVIRHIDESVPVERLEYIIENADKRCSMMLKKLCHDIAVTATRAIKQSD